MTNQHPILVQIELVDEWTERFKDDHPIYLLTHAAQWGADQELEACCTEVSFWGSKGMAEKLRIARRPKPPSLAEEALEAARLELLPGHKSHALILKALERLQELEGGNA